MRYNNYIDDFYKNGIDLLHPTYAGWAQRDTVILEFPLPEAIVATTYFVTGKSVLVARIVFYCFFLYPSSICTNWSK